MNMTPEAKVRERYPWAKVWQTGLWTTGFEVQVLNADMVIERLGEGKTKTEAWQDAANRLR